ncbi:MAG: acetyltransferase [Gammaproteobacteria bacterium RIFCSPHIGHO2_12_FULL_63_22]|nr:MAG: acetyltransferase [Gammaproteobacteria bacterium RIFCSPHIGHO2_12_FULL_63_22]
MSAAVRGRPVESKPRRTAVYIDGYNLYYGRLRHTAHKWLDVVSLFEGILRVQDPAATLDAVKLFSAPALAKFAAHGHESMKAQQSYHRALSILHPERFSLVYGSHTFEVDGTTLPVYVAGQPFDRSVKCKVWKLEEKKTDVNLAIAIYRDVVQGRFEQIVICSNDSDIEPVLQAVREDFPNVVLGLVTPGAPAAEDGSGFRAISKSLARHVDWARKYILDDELVAAQLPLRVATRKRPIEKPSHW